MGATLQDAYLHGSNFTDADLSDANLRDASMLKSNFSHSDVTMADMYGTCFGESVFCNVDLSAAINLNESIHIGPSYLDVSTLYKSGGKISEVFLQRCGMPESLIEYLPSFINSASAIDFYSCFISYSHEDKSFAQRLHDQLQAKGIRCWLDSHQILPGDDIYQSVDRGIRLWDKVLLCASEASLKSVWVEREIDAVVEKEMLLQKQRGEAVLSLIPLNLDGYLFEWEGSHAATLRKRLAADFTGWESDNSKFEEQFGKLLKSLRSDECQRESPPNSKL